MIRFKYGSDEHDWSYSPPGLMGFDVDANKMLRVAVGMLAALFALAGWGHLLITSYFRPMDRKSQHSKMEAVDIRTHDKPKGFWIIMSALRKVLLLCCPMVYLNLHNELRGAKDEHLHLAIKKIKGS